MKLLEILVHTPLAGTIGWALLHSLWQGAILSVTFGALLVGTRSPRVRYASGCVVMLLMLACFSATLFETLPESMHNSRSMKQPAFQPWNLASNADDPSPLRADLKSAIPWLAPFWMVGVSIFYLANVAGWVSVYRMRRCGVCCASERWQNELARLCEQFRLSRPVRLLESCLAKSPAVLGHFRPLFCCLSACLRD